MTLRRSCRRSVGTPAQAVSSPARAGVVQVAARVARRRVARVRRVSSTSARGSRGMCVHRWRRCTTNFSGTSLVSISTSHSSRRQAARTRPWRALATRCRLGRLHRGRRQRNKLLRHRSRSRWSQCRNAQSGARGTRRAFGLWRTRGERFCARARSSRRQARRCRWCSSNRRRRTSAARSCGMSRSRRSCPAPRRRLQLSRRRAQVRVAEVSSLLTVSYVTVTYCGCSGQQVDQG